MDFDIRIGLIRFMLINKIYTLVKKINIKIYMLLLDAMIIGLVPMLALFLRVDGVIAGNEHFFATLNSYMPIVIVITLAVFCLFGLYERIWRYVSVPDLLEIVAAITISILILAGLDFMMVISLPRSIYPISWLLMVLGISALRVLFRMAVWVFYKQTSKAADKLVIIGAGAAGSLVARDIMQQDAGLQIAAFVDDNPEKIGGKLFGIPIMGPIENIVSIVKGKEAAEVIIAIPSASGERIKIIFGLCRQTNCRVRILPSLYELIEERGTLQQLRGIDIHYLLQREAVKFNVKEIEEYISDKVVLVTGAGGSIGGEICRKIARLRPKHIYLLGRGENSIYEIYEELKALVPEISYTPLIVDISEREAVFETFNNYRPQIVFHAAAHKHVPLIEAQPHEAIKVNVFGTQNLADAACEFGVEKFIQISTDKAVNPTSVMGASKRVAEMIIQAKNNGGATKFAAVRFGNVLGSRGSVLPLFRKQIAAGGPITVTHQDMTRYFMTIPEAAQLVLNAGALSTGGEVFILDMGKPVRIVDMARSLVELHGLIPNKDIEIVFTGIRAGEKLFEELLTSAENSLETKHPKIFKAKLNELDYDRLQDALSMLKQERNRCKIIAALSDLLPTYQSSGLFRRQDR